MTLLRCRGASQGHAPSLASGHCQKARLNALARCILFQAATPSNVFAHISRTGSRGSGREPQQNMAPGMCWIWREELEERWGRRGERLGRSAPEKQHCGKDAPQSSQSPAHSVGTTALWLCVPSPPCPSLSPSFHIPRASSEQRRVRGSPCKEKLDPETMQVKWREAPSPGPWLQKPLPILRADGQRGLLWTDCLSPTWPTIPAHVT